MGTYTVNVTLSALDEAVETRRTRVATCNHKYHYLCTSCGSRSFVFVVHVR